MARCTLRSSRRRLRLHDLDLLLDLLWVFGAAVIVVLAVARLRLPSVAGFILAGALIGPHAIGLVRDADAVQTLAEVGVILLLFGVGLEMPIERLRQVLRPMLGGGTLQLLLTGVLSFAGARLVGLATVPAIVVAMLVVPSSTAIVLRGLEVRGELDAPHGQLMLGILLFQDLCVVPMMIFLPVLAGSGGAAAWRELGTSVGLLVMIVGAAALLVPRALHLVVAARQRDAFVLAVVVACLGTAYGAAYAGVSLALGAFLGGVVVAGSEYRHQATAELAPMRELMASLFFVSVGMLLDGRLLLAAPFAVFGTLLALLAGKALVVLIVAAILKLPARVAVMAGVGLSQMGEFALVLARSAERADAIGGGPLQILLSAATLSMILTPLLLTAAPRMATALAHSRVATVFFPASRDSVSPPEGTAFEQHVVVAGFGVAGEALVQSLLERGLSVVVVDLNAESVRGASRRGIPAFFGDVSTLDMLRHVGVAHAREIVLLINDPSALQRAVIGARALSSTVTITVRVRYRREVEHFLALGANEVVVAEVEAGHALVQRVMRHVVSATKEPAA